MQEQRIDEIIQIEGMTCVNCERRIQEAISRLPGVQNARINYSRGQGDFSYDPSVISQQDIYSEIEGLGYSIKSSCKGAENKKSDWAGALLIILAVYILAKNLGLSGVFNMFPQAEAGMGYGMIFIIGLLTSLHCIAMCGGINLSQCLPGTNQQNKSWQALRPSLLYNTGRVVSYTIIGGLVGALGSAIAFSGFAKGIVQLAAGIFMIIMGCNMLGIFPWLRRLNPRLPGFLWTVKNRFNIENRPLVVGLLNGLMPCGPLQAMQIYALSTGSLIQGAVSMFLFSLGTVPAMFGLGLLSAFISNKSMGRAVKAGAVLVVVLGFSMLNNGLALSGIGTPQFVSGNASQAQLTEDMQIVNTSLSPRQYTPITVTKGIPVRWIITAEQGTINGCNNRIIIPAYGIEKSLVVGENIIEFTPEESGTYAYSCWMGMIRSTITVTEADGTVAGANQDLPLFSEGYEPSGYEIPVDSVGIAEISGEAQMISIEMETGRFTPSLIVLQAGLEAEIKIQNPAAAVDSLLFPLYGAQVTLIEGENTIYVVPEQDFDFSTSDYSFYAYVKVVDDIYNFDIEAVKNEVRNYTPYRQNVSMLGQGSGGTSCCQRYY